MKRVDLASIAFVFLSAALLLGLFIDPQSLPQESFCLFQRTAGFDCPGCGLTRAFLLIPRGQWHAVWMYNPAAFFIYTLFLFWIVKIVLQKLKKWPNESKIAKFIEIVLIAVALTVLMGQWTAKGVHYVNSTRNI